MLQYFLRFTSIFRLIEFCLKRQQCPSRRLEGSVVLPARYRFPGVLQRVLRRQMRKFKNTTWSRWPPRKPHRCPKKRWKKFATNLAWTSATAIWWMAGRRTTSPCTDTTTRSSTREECSAGTASPARCTLEWRGRRPKTWRIGWSTSEWRTRWPLGKCSRERWSVWSVNG